MLKANELRKKIYSFLDQRNYDFALKELDYQINTLVDNKNIDLLLFAEIAGAYITLGSEAYDINAVNKGMSLIQNNLNVLKTAVTEDSIDYNLGNGYHAIYKISEKDEPNFFPTPENVKESLFEAKQAYLRAFKKIDLECINDFSIQVLTNLGINLNQSGRIVESLQLFDLVLQYSHEFPQATVSKANGLIDMITATNCQLTISLFVEIYRLFKKASEMNIPHKDINETIETGIKMSAEFLTENNFNFSELENELSLNNQEYLNHPENIKFFLDNFLSLSEHGLYCKCNGAKIDDLGIGFPGFFTHDKKIIELELLNNRLKSEFSLARQLYFEFLTINRTDNIHYEEVVRGIRNGIQHEQLRTSFRLCFGILDKIAEGICYLFDIEIKERENIYFESFWNPKQDPTRWNKINSFRNIHLTALYSIACDLSKQNGEFGFYKIWRNRLEHGLFSLTVDEFENKSWESKSFSEKTTEENFENKTKHLLQLTRAAIFSFVYCVRHELITKNKNSNN